MSIWPGKTKGQGREQKKGKLKRNVCSFANLSQILLQTQGLDTVWNQCLALIYNRALGRSVLFIPHTDLGCSGHELEH